MKVCEGFSASPDAQQAVSEATEDWGTEQASTLDMVFAFCSTKQDVNVVAAELQRRFPQASVAGCTTSGEHLSGRHHNGALVVMGIESPRVRWSAKMVVELKSFDEDRATTAVDGLFADLGVQRESVDPAKMFCLLFIDGLSMQEERVSAILAECTEGIPLIGGSAGDDLAFAETRVMTAGVAKSDAAVLVMGYSERPFEVLKHQHFTTTPNSLVVTKADAESRRVYEFDGLPAAQAYARALGMAREDVTEQVTFLHPVTFLCQGEIYVRSIQSIDPEDDSITFYCGVEEGMVLDIGGHEPMVEALEGDLAPLVERGGADLLIGCNCILRALEAEGKELHDEVGAGWARLSDHSIGFDTYGEQLNGLHINQTLVALAFPKLVA